MKKIKLRDLTAKDIDSLVKYEKEAASYEGQLYSLQIEEDTWERLYPSGLKVTIRIRKGEYTAWYYADGDVEIEIEEPKENSNEN